jgi:hypothetical protein
MSGREIPARAGGRSVVLLGMTLACVSGIPGTLDAQRPTPRQLPHLPGRMPAAAQPGGAPAAQPCVTDPSQIATPTSASVSQISVGFTRKPPPPPKPTKTNAPRTIDESMIVRPASVEADLSPQLCESLKAGAITTEEVTAVLKTMEKEHARKTHTKRRTFKKLGVSYTWEYTLDMGDLKLVQKPGVGYCSDFDWRYKVRNISQTPFNLFSTTGEVGVCFSPGFGLFYVPGLSAVQPFPIPGLCFDDAAITKLDLRNVNDKFEGGLVQLVDLAFAKLQKYDAKVCIIGSPYPPWFMPVIIPTGQMVAYCTSTRHCEIDAAQLLAAARGEGNKE